MMTDNPPVVPVAERDRGIGGRECVPYFDTNKGQLIFEFFYLVVLFTLAVIFLLAVQFKFIPVAHGNKLYLFAVVGGFLGGWVYDAKWFYRVTARGKDNQYLQLWECHKFYWRVLTPFLSAVVSFVTYLLLVSGVLPLVVKNSATVASAFSLCFVLGYFSDLVLSRLAAWAEGILPKKNKGNGV